MGNLIWIITFTRTMKSICLSPSLGSFLLVTLMSFSSMVFGQTIRGVVLDSETNDPLPGAAIVWKSTDKSTVYTDFNGKFEIQNAVGITDVTFHIIGYQSLTIPKKELPKGYWTIKMKPDLLTLEEVEVKAGENPAFRIVRNAIEHKKFNNPNKYDTYKYVSYNKNVITYNFDVDSTVTIPDSAQMAKDLENAEQRHLLIIESVTRKEYKAPQHHHEEVIATKISGFKNPNIATVPDGIQHFGFYDDFFLLLSKNYLNPLANGFESRYVFLLKDTLKRGNDTIYVMDYFPTKGANFEGFMGEISITTDGWAIVHVTAKPWDAGKINLSMEQWYEKVDGVHWFPSRLNFELELEKFPLRKNGAVMIGETYLDSVVINQPIPDNHFDHVRVSVKENSGLVGDDFWKVHRIGTLDTKELRTIQYMDSVGDRYHFDGILRMMRHSYRGFLAFGGINVEAKRLLSSNDYEGWRLGLGLYTNEEISKWFSVGGYAGYGFRDEKWKYGGEFKFLFKQNGDGELRFNYFNDLQGPGNTKISYYDRTSFATQFLNVLMDKIEGKSAFLRFRAFDFQIFEIGVTNYELTPTYAYSFFDPQKMSEPVSRYNLGEINFNWRYAYKEVIIANYGQRITTGTRYPVFKLNYSKGIKDFMGGQFDYNKIELGVQIDRFHKNIGRTILNLEGGFIDNTVPFSLNFSGRPSYSPAVSLFVPSSFQTMRFNEFSSNRYFAVFLTHDFQQLLLRSGWFKPGIRITQNFTMGWMDHPEFHTGVPFKSLDKGYWESGLILDNLLRINMMNVGYLGFGAGAFYRYGAYSLPNDIENWTMKITIRYSVN